MFSYENAIRSLVESDKTASDDEKIAVICALVGSKSVESVVSESVKSVGSPLVVSFREAARLLGYKNTSSVRTAIRANLITPFYGPSKRKRATGVVYQSILNATRRK